jgi:general secretion pathway protein B
MSYILDALRKADAERERGAVPSIHTQSRRMPDFDDEEPGSASGIPPWAWLTLGLFLAALAVGGWWQFGAGSEPAAVAVAPAPPPELRMTPPSRMPDVDAASPMAQPKTPPDAEGPSVQSAPAAAAPRPRPVPPNATPSVAAATAPVVAQKPAPKPAPKAAPNPAPNSAPRARNTAAEKPLDPTQVVKFAALNPALKRELPAMALAGAMYSPDPRARMVIINGLVKREGEEVAPGLTVRRIRTNTVVFDYKGQLFEMLV